MMMRMMEDSDRFPDRMLMEEYGMMAGGALMQQNGKIAEAL